MKPFIFIPLISLLIGLSSCNGSGGTSVLRATGAPYEIVVVVDKDIWASSVGDLIHEQLTTPVPYILNTESSMKCTQLESRKFDNFYRYVRNILIVNVNKNQYTKASLLSSINNWANGQAVLYLNAPDIETLEAYLTENKNSLLNFYSKEEMKRARDVLSENYSQIVFEKAKEKFDITINVPKDITKFAENDECLWFTNDAVTGRMDVLIYSFPFVDKETFTLDYLVAKRDSVAKAMVPGSFEGSYMSTEKRVVDYFPSTLNGKYCGILRGLWRMEGGDMMGGPFVSYARVDEKNQRVIVTEGFVFEPRKEKKQYIRRLEAALQTTLLPGESVKSSADIKGEDKKNE